MREWQPLALGQPTHLLGRKWSTIFVEGGAGGLQAGLRGGCGLSLICFEDININVSSGGHYVSKPVPYARYILGYHVGGAISSAS
eukprot:scaffold47995_cov58-Phaeocystis_antarctica.AAC.4